MYRTTHWMAGTWVLLAGMLLVLAPHPSQAVESPTSYGEAARVDTPILRLPMMQTPPTIDGVMSQGEWDDAASLSGFWYDYGQSDFRFMAPPQTQLQVYGGYDKDHLYICFTSPVYPENSWLKARGRFPNVLMHPLYGMLWDDHLELEIRPYNDLAKAFQLGLFRWDVNPINAYCDWYWSIDKGQDMRWQSGARIRSQVDGKRWVVEYAIPFKTMVYGNYAEADERTGEMPFTLPPPDNSVFRAWFVRGIGGNGPFFNAFDNHIWNTTKTQLILDSQAPSFQINEMGPLMDDIVDVRMSVKNHSQRSETVRLGFFVESAEGMIYSTYDSAEFNQGLLELRPGERREIHLKQPFPGISTDGNVLWFDVRSAGRPAKTLFRTRLIRFHGMEGGAIYDTTTTVADGATEAVVVRKPITFRERRLDVIETLRPPRKDFEFIWQFSPYTKKLSVICDKGIHGSSDEARRAVEAKITVMKDNLDEDIVREVRAEFINNFAATVFELPELVDGESYKVGLLLFDENRRIVGERSPEPFTYKVEVWQGNEIGKDDVVWEPFTPIEVNDQGFETLKHRFTLAPSGLPAQIFIKPDIPEMPLEARDGQSLSDEQLLAFGRGPQLRQPMRLEVVIGGQRSEATVTTPATRIRTWQSEVEYRSELEAAGIPITLTVRYDCDGSMHCEMTYGGEQGVAVDSFELVTDIAGRVTLKASETGNGSMTGSDVWESSLPKGEGVVWSSTETNMEMYYNSFVPWLTFGSADRAWSYYCDSDGGWYLDREGSSLQLERDADGQVTWRVLFVNHPVEVAGERSIAFTLLTHPAKPKPENYRESAWHYYLGTAWAAGYQQEPVILPESYLLKDWRRSAGAPKDTPDSERTTFRKDNPPYYRYGQWRNVGVCAALDQIWEDKATYYFEQHIRIGRRVGWWQDEYFPVAFGRSDNLAMDNARLRRAEEIEGDELPWHSGFLTTYMRNHYKRLARVSQSNNVPQRQHTWSNNAARLVESAIWSSLLVEECGAGHRSYEIDLITQFPNSLYQLMSMNYTGLITALCADFAVTWDGDDKRLDRQKLGRCLLNDIGFVPNGPHGTAHHKEQGVRLLTELDKFGFFNSATEIEKVPFWRNEEVLQMGDEPNSRSKVYVTAYRRALENGNGYKVLLVVMNESLDPVELPLRILDPERLFGGANNLKASDVLGQLSAPAGFEQLWQELSQRDGDAPVLRDIESGDIVSRQPGTDEVYGPIHVPFHDYRIFYGHFSGE